MAMLAINGGAPVRDAPWPRWPLWDDAERSRLEDLPLPVRKPLFHILQQYSDGCVHRKPGGWEPFYLSDEILERTKYRPYVT